MGKLKTRSAAKKRFKINKSGKVMRRHSKMRHLLECKSAKKKRRLRRGEVVAPADSARIKAMLPGG